MSLADFRRTLELLEALIRKALALVLSAIAGNVGPNVALFTDLNAYGVGLRDGTVAWVRALRTYATFRANAPNLTVDGITVTTTSAGGTSRWVRNEYSDPSWRLGITDVYIDPQNSTGRASNEAQGIYSAPTALSDPILTWEELKRRWGHGQYVETGDPVSLTINIHVLSNVASPNDLTDFDFVADVDTFVRVVGEAPVVVLAGNLDNPGGYTAHTPTVPVPGGTPATIKVGATVWAPYIGKRIRFPATGAVAIILKDLGGGVARISPPVTTGEAAFAVHPALVNPAQGAAFLVEDLTEIVVSDDWSVRFEGTALGFFQQVNVLDVHVIEGGSQVPFEGGTRADGSVGMIIWYQCVLDRPVGLDTNVAYLGCRADGIDSPHPANGYFYGGAVIPGPTSLYKIAYISGGSNPIGLGVLDYWTTFQNTGVLFTAPAVTGGFAVFDAPVSATQNPGGHAVMVGGPPNIIAGLAATSFRGPGTVYGTGSAGAGMRVASCSRAAYQATPNVTGAVGDLLLADSAVGFAFNPATPGYQPAAGLALTWGNLATPLGAGFGGSAHEPAKDAHLCQAAAT